MRKLISLLIIINLLATPLLQAQTSSKSYLTISVNVDSVDIRIEGIYYGKASSSDPIIEELEAGNYRVTASKEGYKPQTKEVDLRSGDSSQITFVLERPGDFEVDKDKDEEMIGVEYGSLTVVVKRKGKLVPAKVYVDNKFADNAPLSINRLNVGIHEVNVKYKGLEKTREVEIVEDIKKHLEIELLTTSKVELEPQQERTKLYVDNRNYDLPVEIKLSEGNYKFRFSKYGYKTAEKDIYINGQNNYKIKVNLSKNYPQVTAHDVGRKVKRTNNVDYDSKKLGNYHTIGSIIGGVLGLLFGYIITPNEDEDDDSSEIYPYFVGGALFGYLVGNNIEKKEKVKAREQRKIQKYNFETKKLIKIEQEKKYYKNAIKVYTY